MHTDAFHCSVRSVTFLAGKFHRVDWTDRSCLLFAGASRQSGAPTLRLLLTAWRPDSPRAAAQHGAATERAALRHWEHLWCRLTDQKRGGLCRGAAGTCEHLAGEASGAPTLLLNLNIFFYNVTIKETQLRLLLLRVSADRRPGQLFGFG